MKKRWVFWWILNIFWLAIFIVGTIFIFLREVDGAGAYQTTEIKLISFLVLLIAFMFPFIIQIIWLIINFVTSKKQYE